MVILKVYSNPKWVVRVRPEGAYSHNPFNLTNELGLLYGDGLIG
jgi:hypothetical protein